jgi:hypothetical protein
MSSGKECHLISKYFYILSSFSKILSAKLLGQMLPGENIWLVELPAKENNRVMSDPKK